MNQENKEALPQTSAAQVEKARQDNIKRIQNDPKIPADQKAKALQFMGGGGPGGAKPLGATSNTAPPAAK